MRLTFSGWDERLCRGTQKSGTPLSRFLSNIAASGSPLEHQASTRPPAVNEASSFPLPRPYPTRVSLSHKSPTRSDHSRPLFCIFHARSTARVTSRLSPSSVRSSQSIVSIHGHSPVANINKRYERTRQRRHSRAGRREHLRRKHANSTSSFSPFQDSRFDLTSRPSRPANSFVYRRCWRLGSDLGDSVLKLAPRVQVKSNVTDAPFASFRSFPPFSLSFARGEFPAVSSCIARRG